MGGGDKLYITAAEWTSDFGGAKKQKKMPEFKALPFNCCALTFTPFEHPVCTNDGVIFELLNIIPWIKEHHTNPVTEEPLKQQDLIKLNISKNNDGEYQCPITFKTFNNHTHIVAIKSSGNVYCWDAIEELNIKPKNWRDLLTDQKFTRKDIITLQDPHNMSTRNMLSFEFVKRGVSVPDKNIKKVENVTANGVNTSGSTGRILASLEEKKGDHIQSFVSKEGPKYNEAHYSTGLTAYSLTSMAFTPSTTSVAAKISDEDYLFQNIKEKSIFVLKTNLGEMKFELNCREAPKACYNFIQLSKQGYFKNTVFHRLIRGFMVQGGDPTGTGTGGESFWKKPFQDECVRSLRFHSRGLLAMANHGPSTNGSQFFITFASCPHLNDKHTIFGKLIDGEKTLDAIEGVGTVETKPLTPIAIIDSVVELDTFDLLLNKDNIVKKQRQSKLEKREHLQKLKKRAMGITSRNDEIGKYLSKKRVHNFDDI